MRLTKRFFIISGIFLIALALALNLFLGSIYSLPILMYHSIDYVSDKNNKITVSPDIFEKQMRYLSDGGYNVIPLDKAVSYIEKQERPPKKTVAITFDDGNEDNYRYAYPVLKKYNIPATIFVIVNLVGDEGFLDWDQIRELSASGIVDIESHTMDHKWITGLDDKTLENELKGSRRVLEERTGKRIQFLCYPMGGYDERVKAAVKAAGYRAAFATKPKELFPAYDLYAIKRVRISPTSNNLFVFRLKLSGYHAFFRVFQNDYKDIPGMLWRKRSL